MADAPQSRNFTASSALVMPPIPQIGRLTACATCQTMRSAIGRIAGPESPPNTFDRTGRRVATSISIACTALISEIPSAPSSSHTFAMSAIRVTLGESFTRSGPSVAARTDRTSSPNKFGSCPNSMPPAFTCGHEALISIPAIRGCGDTCAASSAYCSGAVPKALAITTTPAGSAGSFSSRKAFTPTFSMLMAFSMPEGVSPMRGGGFPKRGSRVRLLATKPPILSRSRKGANSVP